MSISVSAKPAIKGGGDTGLPWEARPINWLVSGPIVESTAISNNKVLPFLLVNFIPSNSTSSLSTPSLVAPAEIIFLLSLELP